MSEHDIVTETRPVKDFDYVILNERLEGDLRIIPSDREELIVEGFAEIVRRIIVKIEDRVLIISVSGSVLKKIGDLFKTSLSRKKTKYTLYIKQLRGLETRGITVTRCGGLQTNSFSFKSRGVSRATFTNFQAEFLEIHLSNVDKFDVNGNIREQKVIINGTGQYEASNLRSNKAYVKLNGIGKAVVWVTDELTVKTKGIGNVSYYGSPRIDSKTTILTSLKRLGDK